MVRHRGAVLVDANVIIEAHRTQTWAALSGAYQIETVEACIAETLTGFQRRREEQQIDQTALRKSLSGIHEPSDDERSELTDSHPKIEIDAGETSLWTHALDRTDNWLFCGPDKASLRLGCQLGFRDRLVSMERLLRDIGSKTKLALKENYTQLWHERFLTTVVLGS